MAVFHPLKHTLARRKRGIAKRKGKRQRRQWEECFSSNTLRLVSSLSLAVHCRRRQGALREQVQVVYSHSSSPPPFLRCSCAHISLYHIHTVRVRLEQRSGDTARILPRLYRHQKGDLSFHCVTVSIRIASEHFDRRS